MQEAISGIKATQMASMIESQVQQHQLDQQLQNELEAYITRESTKIEDEKTKKVRQKMKELFEVRRAWRAAIEASATNGRAPTTTHNTDTTNTTNTTALSISENSSQRSGSARHEEQQPFQQTLTSSDDYDFETPVQNGERRRRRRQGRRQVQRND